ncbi:MAG: archaeoflavoprotein AfpA, partial [Candidatus Hodarchaeota archaeon]
PVDQMKETKTTRLPDGSMLELMMRDIDVQNTNKLRKMEGIIVLEKPEDIISTISKIIGIPELESTKALSL